MSDAEIVRMLAAAAAHNCYGNTALCTCGNVTDIWERVEPELRKRAIELGYAYKDDDPDE